jgi:hypothetical protein
MPLEGALSVWISTAQIRSAVNPSVASRRSPLRERGLFENAASATLICVEDVIEKPCKPVSGHDDGLILPAESKVLACELVLLGFNLCLA